LKSAQCDLPDAQIADSREIFDISKRIYLMIILHKERLSFCLNPPARTNNRLESSQCPEAAFFSRKKHLFCAADVLDNANSRPQMQIV